MGVCVVGFSFANRQFDVACNGFRGAPEEPSRRTREQIVADEVISTFDEEVFVAVSPQFHGNAVVVSLEQFDVVSLPIVETQKIPKERERRRPS